MTPDEHTTRKERIDRQLSRAGWEVGNLTQVVEEYGMLPVRSDVSVDSPGQTDPNAVGEPEPGYGYLVADYVLKDRQGKPLAVVEAKRTSHDAETGREQAR